MVERGGTDLPAWLTAETGSDGCDEHHVTVSRHVSRDEAGECPGMLLEGVAGPQQVGRRYDLVVQSATTTDDGRCVVDSETIEQDAFYVEVFPGTYVIITRFCR